MKIIRLSKSCISTKEKRSVLEVLNEGFLGMGPYVKKFEQKLSNFFSRDVVCFNSGTAAIHVALQACGIKKNDEVLVPSITYVATYQAITAVGAKPVGCDINEEDLQISIKDIKKKITRKTKAIIPVHLTGSTSNLKEIYSIAKKNKLRVIEDAAHAFGTVYGKKKVGSFGDITCFSFDGIKNITSGEGGCLVTKDLKIIDKSKDIRLLGVSGDTEKRYLGHRSWISNVKEQGYRFHMSDINASIGLAQLARHKYLSTKRKIICRYYDKEFSKNKKIEFFKKNYKNISPHIYIVRIRNLKKRDLLRKELLKYGIQTGIHYYPNYKFSKFKDNAKKFPITEKIYKEILTLPLHPELTLKEIKFVVFQLKKLLRKKNF
tara:strand:- start:1022 stop:2149 length:1128 start_codon:yes stop_codon:yes gene_type:complete